VVVDLGTGILFGTVIVTLQSSNGLVVTILDIPLIQPGISLAWFY
jgi:hypothetical protein